MGEIGRSLSSITTFCDENDGPNVDSNKSKEGICDELAEARGERGSLPCCDLGLFVNDGDGINPETWDDDTDPPAPAVAVSCHSFDLAVLIPRRDLELKGVSLSLGDKFNVLIRLQSLENTSSILCRIFLSMASASHSAKESCERGTTSFFPTTRLRGAERPTSSPPSAGVGEFKHRNCEAAERSFSARCVSFSMFLPRSNHPEENTSNALSKIISVAAMMGSISLWCRRHHMAAFGGLTRKGAIRCTNRR